MAQVRSKLTKTVPIPIDVRPKRSWEKSFRSDSGFAVKVLRYWMSVFIHHELADPSYRRRSSFLVRPRVAARCLSCVGEEWELRSEPTGADAAGLVMYTAAGKALGSGTVRLRKTGLLLFELSTLYKGMTNAISKIDYKIEGKGNSDGSWSVTGSVTVSDTR